MRGYFGNDSNVETGSDVIEAQSIVLQISSAYGLAKHRNGQMSAGSGQRPRRLSISKILTCSCKMSFNPCLFVQKINSF
jgi:hypothetical protein